jgi:hypothetical protein
MRYVIEGQGGLNFLGNRSLWSRLSQHFHFLRDLWMHGL